MILLSVQEARELYAYCVSAYLDRNKYGALHLLLERIRCEVIDAERAERQMTELPGRAEALGQRTGLLPQGTVVPQGKQAPMSPTATYNGVTYYQGPVVCERHRMPDGTERQITVPGGMVNERGLICPICYSKARPANEQESARFTAACGGQHEQA